MTEFIWAVVVLAAVVLLIAFVARALTTRRAKPAFKTRALPVGYFNAYQTRITELQTMFVEQPRDAVAAAKHMVEDLMVRLGYPTRLTEEGVLKVEKLLKVENLYDPRNMEILHHTQQGLRAHIFAPEQVFQQSHPVRGAVAPRRPMTGTVLDGADRFLPWESIGQGISFEVVATGEPKKPRFQVD